MVCSSHRVWPVTLHNTPTYKNCLFVFSLCFPLWLCMPLAPAPLCTRHQMVCTPIFPSVTPLSASLCFHNSSILYPVDLCRSPFLFLVVNTFPSMLNNVCLFVQVFLVYSELMSCCSFSSSSLILFLYSERLKSLMLKENVVRINQ